MPQPLATAEPRFGRGCGPDIGIDGYLGKLAERVGDLLPADVDAMPTDHLAVAVHQFAYPYPEFVDRDAIHGPHSDCQSRQFVEKPSPCAIACRCRDDLTTQNRPVPSVNDTDRRLGAANIDADSQVIRQSGWLHDWTR